jgi:hypothetical protein
VNSSSGFSYRQLRRLLGHAGPFPEAANDAQHAGYWAQQDTNAKNSAGFSNYLLDQSVVQNNNVGGTGEVGHATVWNSTANALVKANPNKYEIVNTPNYWQSVDS